MIDSGAWIEYFKGSIVGQKAKLYVEGSEEIIVSAMNMAEVHLFCLRNELAPNYYLNFILKTAFVVPVSLEIGIAGAITKHINKMGMSDALILATARTHNARVITGDTDFNGVADVVVIS